MWGIKLGAVACAWLLSVSAISTFKFASGDNSSGRIVFGNYEGYIDPDLFDELKDRHGVSIDYFDYDHVVAEKFESGIYDAAIVSTSVLLGLKERNLMQAIDWGKLGFSKDNTKDKFSDTVKSILEDNEDFLKYGMPYFLNKLSFCYSGNQISSLNTKVSWKKLIEEISKEDRFRSSRGRAQLAMIDDPRTIFSMAKLVKNNGGNGGVKWNSSDNIEGFYNHLKTTGLNRSKLGNNFLLMSSSSSTIVDALVSGSVKGGFMYNGDCLYAAYGGNLGENFAPENNQFHIVEMDKDIYFLDFLVFSKNMSESKKEKAYEFAKELLFDGKDSNDILGKDGDKYKHVSVRNFDYVKYTPVLKCLESKATDETNGYLKDESKLKDTKKKILKVEKPSGTASDYYENAMNSRDKSNLFMEFEKFKLSL